MYKVMIVDDETIVHHGLKVCLDWNEFQCEILQNAYDGVEALEQIERSKPDIVITDIKMPGMDGVALSKHLFEQYPDIQIIMLTGLTDIEYARQAMNYNVTSYILKPTDTEEIKKALEKAVQQIRQEQRRKQQFLELEERVAHNRTIARQKLLSDILHGVINDEQRILREAQRVHLQGETYMLFVMQVEERACETPGLFLKETQTDRIILVETILKNAFQDQLQDTVRLDALTLAGLLHTLRLPLEPHASLTNLANTIDFIHHALNFRVSVGISAIHQGIVTIRQAYQEANHALKQRFFQSDPYTLFVYEQPSPAQENVQLACPTVKNYIEDLFSCLQSYDENATHRALDRFFQDHEKLHVTIDHVKNNCISLCSLCTNYVFTHSAVPEHEHLPHPHIYQQILESQTFSDLKRLVLDYFTSLAQIFHVQQQDTHYIIRKARNVIRENYHHSISLQTISDAIFVNPSYLSRLFRKETGHTLTEEILAVRMKKAKELLHHTEQRVKEIAMQVGYEDASYFSRSFKDYTGLSPNAYRRARR